jgi:hypothetical protein
MAAKKEHAAADPHEVALHKAFDTIADAHAKGWQFDVIRKPDGSPDYHVVNYIGPKVERVTVAADGSTTPVIPEAAEEVKG